MARSGDEWQFNGHSMAISVHQWPSPFQPVAAVGYYGGAPRSAGYNLPHQEAAAHAKRVVRPLHATTDSATAPTSRLLERPGAACDEPRNG